MANQVVTAKQIKPKEKNVSDFFSWRLYQWVMKNPDALRIYKGTWNSIDGVDPENPILYIGRDKSSNWLSAVPLSRLCSFSSSRKLVGYSSGHDIDNWEDITDAFWAEYLRIGVCAIHGDNAHKWEVDPENSNARACEYCGTRELKRSKMVKKEYWVADSTAYPEVTA